MRRCRALTAVARTAGFTLIELLVVIAIIATLAAVLLPRVFESRLAANIFADQANLRWHYANWVTYNARKLGPPTQGGHQFVFEPWFKQVCERTEANRDRFFSPGTMDSDPRWGELKALPIDEIWKRSSDVFSQDTNYAGRGKKYLTSAFKSGNEPLMANDNEYDNAFSDGTINVLLANGSVKELKKAEELKELWPEDDKDFVFPVGPESPYELLQKLEK